MATNAGGMRDRTAGWMALGPSLQKDAFGRKQPVYDIGEYGEKTSWSEWFGSGLSRVLPTDRNNRLRPQDWLFKRSAQDAASDVTGENKRAAEMIQQTKGKESVAAFAAQQRAADQEYGSQVIQIKRQKELMDLESRIERVGLAAGRGINDPGQRELAESQARRREFDRDAEKSRMELDRLRQQRSRFMATGLGETVKPEAIIEAEKTRLEYLRRGLEIRRQEYDAQKRVNDEATAGAQRAIGILQQRKGIYAQQAEALRQEYRTGAEAWGSMDAGQRQWAKNLKERFDRGEELRPEQEQELLNTPISAQMRERIRKRQRDRGEREGYREFAGGEIDERLAATDRLQSGIQRRVDVRQEVVVRIERDDQELLKKFRAEAVQVNEQIAGLVAADMNRSLEAYGVKIVQAMNQAFSKAGSQASAKIETQAAQRGAAGAN